MDEDNQLNNTDHYDYFSYGQMISAPIMSHHGQYDEDGQSYAMQQNNQLMYQMHNPQHNHNHNHNLNQQQQQQQHQHQQQYLKQNINGGRLDMEQRPIQNNNLLLKNQMNVKVEENQQKKTKGKAKLVIQNNKSSYQNKIKKLLEEESEEMDDLNIDSKSESSMEEIHSEEDLGNLEKGSKTKKPKTSKEMNEFFGINEESKKIQKAKNRESARISRKRKKVYLKLLEKKLNQCQKELDEKNRLLAEKDQYLSKIQYSTSILDHYFSGYEKFYQQLNYLLKQNPVHDDGSQMNMLLDSMRLRMGVSGQERQNAMNYFFQQYINIGIPDHLRYLLWAATEEKDLFDSQSKYGQFEEKPKWRLDLLDSVKITDNQKDKLKKFQPVFKTQRANIDGLFAKLIQLKDQVNDEMRSIELAVDKMRDIFQPRQIAEFIRFLEKNTDNKDYTHARLWDSIGQNKDFQFLEQYDESQYCVYQMLRKERQLMQEKADQEVPVKGKKKKGQ